LKTIPIFRARDGFQNLKNNQATFERVYKLLGEGNNILILAEGVCKHEKRMRPIQKGTARMAFGTFEKYGTRNIGIIPVGVNFTDPNRFRSEVMVDVGPVIDLEDFMADYDQNPRRGVTQLTKEISKRMKKRIVHIDDPADDAFVERLLTLNRNFKQESMLPALARGHNWLWEEKQIADRVNAMAPADKTQLRAEVEQYFDALDQQGISDVAVAKPRYYNWVNTLIIILGSIPFLLGLVANVWPLLFARWLADRVVKQVQFHASVNFAVGMFSYALYWLVLMIWALISGSLPFMIIVGLMPFIGFAALQYRDFYQKWIAALRFHRLDKSTRESLKEQRERVSQKGAIPSGVIEERA
ncbi:MAG: 1-acyl-sn-glycerol-3-phosphate acyltransferase, partial [Bacteroidota bacterium]